MEVASGTLFATQQRIVAKLLAMEATSKEKAVTFEEAELDLQEQYWLNYFAGIFLGRIKKTEDHRYYI